MEWFASVLQTIILALLMYVLTHTLDKKYEAKEKQAEERQILAEEQAKARKEECLLGLHLQSATNKMSYAVAKAIQRGYANGEVEVGIAAYEIADKEYIDFMTKQAADSIAI